MKHFSLFIFLFSFLFAACSKEEVATQQGDQPTTFQVEAPATRTAVTGLSRYIVEAYEGKALGATPVRAETNNGSMTVILKKNTDYTLLFWADKGTAATEGVASSGYWNTDDLKAVTVTETEKNKVGQAAYCHKLEINSKELTPNYAIQLKNATAQVNFIESVGLETADNTLKVTYAAGATLNVGTGTITEVTGAVTHTFASIPTVVADAIIATDYVLAPLGDKNLLDIEMQFNSEEVKELTNVPFQQIFKTNIKGEYSNFFAGVFEVTADDDWNVPENEVEFPTNVMSLTIDTRKNSASDATFILPLEGRFVDYDFTVDWGDGTSSTFASDTTLAQANMTHEYPSAGEYTIIITSTQLDPTQQQLRKLSFYGNYRTVNNNSKKLISLNSPLLNMGVSLSYSFSGCTNLTTISEKLFAKNIAAANFSYCFRDCTNLTGEIPGALFAANTEANNFSACFRGCTGLTGKIPGTLFAANGKVTDFSECFYGCTNLTGEIPGTLFAANGKATDFSDCFNGCSSLTDTIPAGLFTANTEATTFLTCFRGCSGLTGEIPEALFTANTKVDNFSGCFNGCSGLTDTIPARLFAANGKATNFSTCFLNCTGLTGEIPAGLFRMNTLATNFSNCFKSCTKLKLNADIFCDEMTEKANRFAGKKMNFNSCFYDCGSALIDGQGGIAPALWSYAMDASSTKSSCFYGVTKVTNVIDSAWK